MIIRTAIAAFLIVGGTSLPVAESAVKTAGMAVPFELEGHIIWLTVRINDNSGDYRFVFDTGALAAIDESVAAELGIAKGAPIPAFSAGDRAWFGSRCSLRIGDLPLPAITPFIFDFEGKRDGFIGSNSLADFVVVLDYEQRNLYLYDTCDISVEEEDGHKMSFSSHFPTQAPMVNCWINDTLRPNGMIDNGSPFAFVFPLAFIDSLSGVEKLELVRSISVISRWPMSSTDEAYLSRLSSINIGTIHLKNVPVIFADVNEVLIGKEFLEHFVTTIDYPRKMILLQPREGETFQSNVYSSGLKLTRNESGQTIVKGFWEGSPAHRSGLQIGDAILEVNFRDAAEVSIWGIRQLLEDRKIEVIDLTIESSRGNETISLSKENLLSVSKSSPR